MRRWVEGVDVTWSHFVPQSNEVVHCNMHIRTYIIGWTDTNWLITTSFSKTQSPPSPSPSPISNKSKTKVEMAIGTGYKATSASSPIPSSLPPCPLLFPSLSRLPFSVIHSLTSNLNRAPPQFFSGSKHPSIHQRRASQQGVLGVGAWINDNARRLQHCRQTGSVA